MSEVDRISKDLIESAIQEIVDKEAKDIDKSTSMEVDKEAIVVDKPTNMEVVVNKAKDVDKPTDMEVVVNEAKDVDKTIDMEVVDEEIKNAEKPTNIKVVNEETKDVDKPTDMEVVDKESKDITKPRNMEVVDKESKDMTKPTNMEVDDDLAVNKENKGTSQVANNEIVIEIKSEPKDEAEVEQSKSSDVVSDQSVKKSDDSPESIESSEPDLKEIIRRSAGASNTDDGEKMIQLTADEAKQYLLKKIGEYMNSSINPLFNLRAKAKDLEERGKNQVEEYCKLYKGLQLLQRKHENFLRNVDVLPKITMCHANVSADLPMEPVPNPEALLKKDLSITRIDNLANKAISNPSSAQTKTTITPVVKPSNIECIDLTDEMDTPPAATSAKNAADTGSIMMVLKHPAPLPPRPFATNVKKVPPKPRLKISAEDRGIVLQWDMPPNPKTNPIFDPIASFEIFGYQEQKNLAINTALWKKIGSVKSMSLPMACTLTQFVDGNKYHFAIRAVDINGLCGNYSDAISIVYKQKITK